MHSHYTKMYLSTTCVVVREFQFPGAIQIVDIFHARQHLWDVARKLYPGQEAEQKRWMDIHQNKLLDEGKIEELVTALRAIDSLNPELLEKIRSEADYFDNNMQRMRYPTYREQHLFIGSASSKQAAKPSLVPDASSPACSGPFAAPTPSSPSAAVTSTDGLRTTGRPGAQPDTYTSMSRTPSRWVLNRFGGSVTWDHIVGFMRGESVADGGF